MTFDLLTLKIAHKTKVDSEGIANLKKELERRREAKEKLGKTEKARVTAFLVANISVACEDTPFHAALIKLAGYVRNKA
jgi:formate dehydrogenase assembly factor FdhD